jgi:hypothetical protein
MQQAKESPDLQGFPDILATFPRAAVELNFFERGPVLVSAEKPTSEIQRKLLRRVLALCHSNSEAF